MRHRERGFTLIELLIVVAIIAIVAAIAIPNLLASKLSANETAALASLRNLVSAQAQVQTAARIDSDGDGVGEYGTLLEMSGTVGVRKGYTPPASPTPGTSSFAVLGAKIAPPVLPQTMAAVGPNGYVTKAGYAILVFLPDGNPATDFVHETGPAATVGLAGGTGSVNVNLSETMWSAYAQPMAMGNTGNRRFFVSPHGDVLQSSNDVARGQGTATVLNGNSALRGAGFTARAAIGTSGQDGDIWRLLN